MMNILKKSRNENGAAVVEFAIITPLLLVLLFGIIEFTFILYDKAMITNASREGAREGILFSDPRRGIDEIRSDVTNVVNAYCDSGNYLVSFGGGPLTVSVNATGNSAGDSLTVTVDYLYHSLAFSSVIKLFGGSLGDSGGNVNLRAESVMRLE